MHFFKKHHVHEIQRKKYTSTNSIIRLLCVKLVSGYSDLSENYELFKQNRALEKKENDFYLNFLILVDNLSNYGIFIMDYKL